MKKQVAKNTFTEGLVMDFNPLVTPDNVVTNCLNGTLITYNGNELVLLNDMGNGRVETAYLPEGYVPLGTAELGGIIYIVSYNPLIGKCLIGCFPSPERNITSDEIKTSNISVVDNALFQSTNDNDNGRIINTILKVKLLSDPNSKDGLFKLNPGDKYTIYSTNGGISNNNGESDENGKLIKTPKISDVGSTTHIVDYDPRTVTIHVVSIGEDGKIVYLDDSLKWSGCIGDDNLDYYIKEVEKGEDILTDIDDYDSLVSSAYNVFNSKVSGELALLFELKVIDTFSVAWDAEVDDKDPDRTKATIKFLINYTSSHENINLAHVLLTDSAGTRNFLETSDGIFGDSQPILSCSFEDETKGRNNDGFDNPISVEVGDFYYNSGENLNQYVWNYEVTPAMKFGYLDSLSQRGSINFSEIGSGHITLDEWRYFIEKDSFYLSWGLSAYPAKNKKIHKVVMTFIPFYEVSKDAIDNLEKDFEKNGSNYPLYIVSGKGSYSGYFTELIPFGTTNQQKLLNHEIVADSLYLVDVCVEYDTNRLHNYRWLYTTKQWNDVYREGIVRKFDTLTLDKVLKLSPKLSIVDNVDRYTDTHLSNVKFPTTCDDVDPTYLATGALITTVNYSDSNNEFDTSKDSILVDINTEYITYPNLFKFLRSLDDKYHIEIDTGKSGITHDDIIPTSDTKNSSLSTYVESNIKEDFGLEDNLNNTVKEIISKGITNKEVDSLARDSFVAELAQSQQDDSKFGLKLTGAIFSRINADFKTEPVTVGQEIRPFLYNRSDYLRLGLQDRDAFSLTFTEYHEDEGKGDPFYFKFSTKEGTFTCISTGKSSNDDNFGPDNVHWDPGDRWSENYWWNIPPYNQGLNPNMLAAPGSFLIMEYDKGTKGCTFNGKDMRGKYLLWVRTSADNYIAINQIANEVSELANIVALLYALLYYVNANTSKRECPVVSNINYVTNYSETWNTYVDISLDVSDILSSTVLTCKDYSKSLSELIDNSKNIPGINNSNLTYKTDENSLHLGLHNLKHTFYIQNIDLYNQYEDLKSTTIPAIALLSTEDSWVKCLPRTENTLYVHNLEDLSSIDFVKLDDYTASSNLRYGGMVFSSGDDKERVKLSLGRISMSREDSIIYKYLELKNDTLDFLLTPLITSSKSISFTTSADGNSTSYVHKNSSYKLFNDE